MTKLTVDFFKALTDHELSQGHVTRTLNTLQRGSDITRFIARYAAWNSRFAPGVAQLVANIGDQPGLFIEPGQPYALADRSNFVASFIFDAARDEFNDHITRHRDPHRSLAQATLSALAQHTGSEHVLEEREPPWLKTLCEAVVWSYNGGNVDEGNVGEPNVLKRLFSGIGFHLGSELLADAEFSLIDDHLRQHHNELVQKLLRTKVEIGGFEHRAYAWIGVHSGHDGAAEADHFDWALQGVNEALRLIKAQDREEAKLQLRLGYLRFVSMHTMFFSMVGEA